MIVLASRNGRIGLPAAMEAMASGGSAVDAVEAGTRVVERNRSVVGTPGTRRIVPFQSEAERIDLIVADGTARICPMGFELAAE